MKRIFHPLLRIFGVEIIPSSPLAKISTLVLPEYILVPFSHTLRKIFPSHMNIINVRATKAKALEKFTGCGNSWQQMKPKSCKSKTQTERNISEKRVRLRTPRLEFMLQLPKIFLLTKYDKFTGYRARHTYTGLGTFTLIDFLVLISFFGILTSF